MFGQSYNIVMFLCTTLQLIMIVVLFDNTYYQIILLLSKVLHCFIVRTLINHVRYINVVSFDGIIIFHVCFLFGGSAWRLI